MDALLFGCRYEPALPRCAVQSARRQMFEHDAGLVRIDAYGIDRNKNPALVVAEVDEQSGCDSRRIVAFRQNADHL